MKALSKTEFEMVLSNYTHLQMGRRGYELYKVRSMGNDTFHIEAFTPLGKYLKSKLRYGTQAAVLEFIGNDVMKKET